MHNLARKWRELAPLLFRATATAPLLFTLAPPRRVSPFLVRTSGAGALKVEQVPSTAHHTKTIILRYMWNLFPSALA